MICPLTRWRRVRRCRGLLSSFGVPYGVPVEELCRLVGARRGRPIVTSPMRLAAAGVSGLWLRGHAADYVCYEEQTSVAHQHHIILHELGHIAFGHQGASHDTGALFSQVSDATVRLMLSRTPLTRSGRAEAEAETFAHVAGTRLLARSGGGDLIARTLEA